MGSEWPRHSSTVRVALVEIWAFHVHPFGLSLSKPGYSTPNPFGLSLSKPGRCCRARLFWQHACVEGGSRVVAPAGDSLFFASPKKSKQKKGDPQSATPSRCEGANLRRGACGVRRRTHCAPLALRSDNCGESVHEACAHWRACHPATAPPQAQPAGVGQPHGPSLRSAPFAGAGAARRASGAERSDGPSGCSAFPPFRMRRGAQGVGWRVCRRTHALRELTCRSCLNAAPKARSEFCGTPHARAPQVARSEAKGRSM